jgi:heme a synthase
MTTYISTALLWSQIWRPGIRSAIPPVVRACIHTAFAVVNVQAILGISTLLYLVPTPLAAAHQAGSVAVLSAMIHLLIALQGPGRVALARRMALVRTPSYSPPSSARKALSSTITEPKNNSSRAF